MVSAAHVAEPLFASTAQAVEEFARMRRHAFRIMRGGDDAQDLDLDSTCRRLTREVAQTLNVARVGAWFFDSTGQSLRCASLFSNESAGSGAPEQISALQFPTYMRAISSDELVVAVDALTHPQTAELSDAYLRPLGIASMLDAPILRGGGTAGVLCVEHGPERRHWTTAEASFVDAIAAHIGRVMEVIAQKELSEINTRLAAIIETTPDVVFTTDVQGRMVYLNRAGRVLTGFGESESLEGLNALSYVPADLVERRREEIVPHAIKFGSWQGEVALLTRSGERIPAWEYFVAHTGPDGRVHHFSAVMRDLREQKRHEGDIRQREVQLHVLNEELERRVVERTRRIEEINQNLETFAFSVSHDLKGPLRGIDGYSRLLMEEHQASLSSEAKVFVGNIRQAAQGMATLIDDLLNYSRLSRRELACVVVNLRQVLSLVLQESSHDRSDRGVRLIDEVQEHWVIADLDCLKQILRNLIDNAVKFTRDVEQPVVQLSAGLDGGRLVFAVRDNGCGFDMKYHDRIFHIFQRLHAGTAFPGTGVGLAIVGKAVERIGAKVWAESAPGRGATFFLSLQCPIPGEPAVAGHEQSVSP